VVNGIPRGNPFSSRELSDFIAAMRRRIKAKGFRQLHGEKFYWSDVDSPMDVYLDMIQLGRIMYQLRTRLTASYAASIIVRLWLRVCRGEIGPVRIASVGCPTNDHGDPLIEADGFVPYYNIIFTQKGTNVRVMMTLHKNRGKTGVVEVN
jgi:hypothetical protein